MTFRFTIGKKIGLGFGVLILLTMVAFVYTLKNITYNKQKTELVVGEVIPSIAKLKELNTLLGKSHNLITKWYYVQSPDDDPFKNELRHLIKIDYPNLKEDILLRSKKWAKKERNELDTLFVSISNLFTLYQEDIMNQLNSYESYDDANVEFLIILPYQDAENQLNHLREKLDGFIFNKTNDSAMVKKEMFHSLNFLEKLVKYLSIILIVGGILISVYTVNSIVKPVKHLKKMILSMSQGILPKERITQRKDEIGEMGYALSELIDSMEDTTEFAKQTGSGNFNASFKPLSNDDTLGHALLKMRDNLAQNERVLEQKVIERTEEVVRQKQEIEHKTNQLEALYTQVTDSIHYAKRLQEAILPPDSLVKSLLPKSFILYKPKDIVSGDFYWLGEKNNWTYFATVDCTGHGVPGAFMSIVGYNLLKDIVHNSSAAKPSDILDKMAEGVVATLHSESAEQQTKDGMDMTLCALNKDTLELQYASAFNPLYIIRNNELTQYKADKFPVGLHYGEKMSFTNNSIQLQKGDLIYLFSDGYADQFGGEKGKKFMAVNFRHLLSKVCNLPLPQQKATLDKAIENWRGDLEQVDDILVMGIQV